MARRSFLGVLTVGFLLVAPPVLAGIAFETMPIGCSWTIKYSDGQTNTETYLGVKSGKHKTKVTQADNPEKIVRHSYYDRKGRLVRKDWANGKWEQFSPFSCFDSQKSCSYTYSNADGARKKIASETKATGKGFKVIAGPVGGTPYPDEYFELGQFGLMIKNSSSTYSARVITLKDCNLGS